MKEQFTERAYARAVAWREAAIADGWDHAPTYQIEGEERACRLTRDGFVMQIISREPREKTARTMATFKHEGSVSAWSSDGMSINLPEHYAWAAIQAGPRTCNECGAADVETFRYSFAGRACAKCLPAAKKAHEYPGWAN